MKTLPKYWVVEKTKENVEVFKKTVIPYLLDVYGEMWREDSYRFYGYDGNESFKGTNGWNSISKFENNPTLLTLDEFIKLTKEESNVIEAAKSQGMIKEEFVLPEKWAVARNIENYRVLNDWCNSHKGVSGTDSENGYIHSHNYGYSWKGSDGGYYYANLKQKHPDHTEITFEQFKKYVLKQEEVMDKEIIGYKLKKDCQQYLEAAEIIANFMPDGAIPLERFLEKSQWGVFKENLEKAGVLDLWFEPIYKEGPKYKVGDWVLTSNNANGWGSGVSEVNNKILKITKIDLEDLEFHGNRYYFGKEMTAGKEIVRLATPEEIEKATTKEFPIGSYKAVVKDGNIIIDGKGRISVEAFNNLYEGWLQDALGTTVEDYEVSLTVATIKIGCVKDITLKQAKELYNYTKTL